MILYAMLYLLLGPMEKTSPGKDSSYSITCLEQDSFPDRGRLAGRAIRVDA